MYFQASEHNPPHLHVVYGDDTAEISLSTFEILEGHLPNNALRLVRKWMRINQDELLKMWKTQKFKKLKPLE